MSTRICSRLVFRTRSTQWVPSTSVPSTPRRTITGPSKPEDKEAEDLSNPILDKYIQEREFDKAASRVRGRTRPQLRQGKLSTEGSSLILPEREIPGWRPDLSEAQQKVLKMRAEEKRAEVAAHQDFERSSKILDPVPEKRIKLERRLVIAGVERRGRLTKAQTLARTERQSLYKSHSLPTSVKKLQKVVNQIAGKTVSDALVQLRFSNKKVARDVLKGLEIARDEAMAGRGMGLGEKTTYKRWMKRRAETGSKDISVASDASIRAPVQVRAKNNPTIIELKDGTKRTVTDPTEIYIDQAWVGKGEGWKSYEHRARGRINILKHPTTSFSVLLKEQRTRIRIAKEIQQKREKRKIWSALPDRPITAQRQYYLW